MFFIVSKLTFEPEPTARDAKELAQLADKLRQRFKISIQIADEFYKGGQAGIVVAAVHREEMQLSNLIDEIADACENSGYGRIHSESTILEDFESYANEEE
jgi:2'-5' RNA ligase